MARKQTRSAGKGIERSCRAGRSDWFRSSEPVEGVELLEAWFQGQAYGKHRHDTYAVGVTESGVQSFAYRGGIEASTPGKVIVLHPDEMHDGHAGTEEGFGYRMIYLEPRRVSEAARQIGGGPVALPFVRQAVSSNPPLAQAVRAAFAHPYEPLAVDSLVAKLTEGLLDADPATKRLHRRRWLDAPALERARQFLDAEKHRVVRSSELEAVTGLSRYDLARQFRAMFGTSPYRYLLLRRLDAARRDLTPGHSLAAVAQEAGFADQAHFTRMFKSAYGVTPARYTALRTSDSP